jgi:hypothetical protein
MLLFHPIFLEFNNLIAVKTGLMDFFRVDIQSSQRKTEMLFRMAHFLSDF